MSTARSAGTPGVENQNISERTNWLPTPSNQGLHRIIEEPPNSRTPPLIVDLENV